MKNVLVSISILLTGPLAVAQYNLRQSETWPVSFSETSPVIKKKENRVWHAVKVPALLAGVGAYACVNHDVINKYKVREERNEHIPNFQTSVDDYLMHAPIAVVYGLNLAGVKGKHDFRNRTLLLVKSEAIMYVLMQGMKTVTNVQRPDGTDFQSFPSGHTAQAFATATFMAKEYGDKSPWYTVGAYTMASAVGVMRVLNNRHWISDVFTGAGIGILSTNIAYLTHRYRWKNAPSQLTVMPAYAAGPSLYVSYRLQ